MHPQSTSLPVNSAIAVAPRRRSLDTFYDGRPHYVVDAAGCWLWQGGLTRAGYGLCSSWTGHRFAHRWYYARHHGPLGSELHVHHVCRVPRCVNPAHLEAITPQENLALRQWGCPPTPGAAARPSLPTSSAALAGEQWRTVPGYESYYSVSSHGRVRRDCGGRGTRAGHLCKAHRDRKGYLRVTLIVNSHHRGFAVHRLVAAAFLRPPLPGEQVNHLNGTKSDNRPANLEWCSGLENMRHAVKNGLRPDMRGQRNGRAKVTPAQVQEIRSLRGKLRQIDIATLYGLSQSQVSAIQVSSSWSD